MVERSSCTTLWKSADPRLRIFVTFGSPIQAAAAIRAGQVQIRSRVLIISCLSAMDSSVVSYLQQSAQRPRTPEQLPTPVTPVAHNPPSTFPVVPSSAPRQSSIPDPTEAVLTTPRCHGLSVPQSRLLSHTTLVSSSPNPVRKLPMQASVNSSAILDTSECATKRLQQELDEFKQRYRQLHDEKNVLDRRNAELLAQYDQAITDRSRVDHELLSARNKNRSLNEEKKSLQRKLWDTCRNQKDRDKQWHARCESIKGEWQTANISLAAELKDLTRQRDESIRALQTCENEFRVVSGALEKEVAKRDREEQELEIQVLRSREVIEPEMLHAFRAIEGLADKGTVKIERPPTLLSVHGKPSTTTRSVRRLLQRRRAAERSRAKDPLSRVKKEDVGVFQRMVCD